MKDFFRANRFYRQSSDLDYNGLAYLRAPVSYVNDVLDLLRRPQYLEKTDEDFIDGPWKCLQQAGYTGAFELCNAVSSSANALLSNIRFINEHGFGNFQFVEEQSNRIMIRVYNGLEDRLYKERYEKATRPISAFTSGIVKAICDHSVSSGETAEELYESRSRIEQTRCEAEDGSFSEFIVTPKL